MSVYKIVCAAIIETIESQQLRKKEQTKHFNRIQLSFSFR